MNEVDNIWPKQITVDRNIVSVLSQSTYQNFPRALKELITNSYDADARTVNIKIDLSNETIVISDNGRGMTDSDFEFYIRIAGKKRTKGDNRTPLGRQIIGQFGVGFLAVFPFFKSYNIETKTAGTPTMLFANIPLSKYFSDQNRMVDIGSILINGGKKRDYTRSNQSFTKITLTGFNDLTKAFFYPKQQGKTNKHSVETYASIDKLRWILSDDLPINFKEDRFNELFSLERMPQFEVNINGVRLYRQVYGEEILETHKGEYHTIGNIKFKYVILTPRKSVKPYEARYLKIRNLNVGVGDNRENFAQGHGATRSRIHWLTGEVHIIDGMNDLIKVSRDDFNFSPHYEDFKIFMNSRLNYFSNRLEDEADLTREIHQTGKDFRVSNLSLLNPDNIAKKIQKLEDEGFTMRQLQESDINKPVTINDETKEIIVSASLTGFEKYIVIKNKRYLVISDSWDYRSDSYPACKLEGTTLVLNTSYPLFSGRKYTDLFVKMHLLLLINLSQNNIDQENFTHLTNEILEYFSDYI